MSWPNSCIRATSVQLFFSSSCLPVPDQYWYFVGLLPYLEHWMTVFFCLKENYAKRAEGCFVSLLRITLLQGWLSLCTPWKVTMTTCYDVTLPWSSSHILLCINLYEIRREGVKKRKSVLKITLQRLWMIYIAGCSSYAVMEIV